MKLYKHQEEALRVTDGKPNVAYYLDMGLGKTFVGSERMFGYRMTTNLIVCQKSKVSDWVRHVSGNYDLDVFDLTKKKQLTEFLLSKRHKVGVVNYELQWRRKELQGLKDFCLMLDESSLIQNKKSKQTKAIMKMKPSHVILLSGTPSSGKYENLWTQLFLLGYGISEDAFFKQYVNFKLIKVGGVVHKTVDMDNPYKNVDRLKRKMVEHGAVFMKTEDAYDLPDQNFSLIYCGRPREYDRMIKHDYVVIDGHELVGDTSLTKRLRLRQICGSYNSYKLEAVRDIVSSTRDRIVIFYNFNDEMEKLVEVCGGRTVAVVNGGARQIDVYNDHDDCVLLVQYQAGAMGLNLQAGNKIVYYTLPERSELFEQSKKRIHRIGQEKKCFYWLLITENSIEQGIYEALQMRKDYNDELFRKESGYV